MSGGTLFALVCAVIGIAYGAVSIKWILAQPDGNERMREIAAAVKEGASAYLKRQYTTIGIVGVVLFLVIQWRAMFLTLKNRGIRWRDTHYPLEELKANRV